MSDLRSTIRSLRSAPSTFIGPDRQHPFGIAHAMLEASRRRRAAMSAKEKRREAEEIERQLIEFRRTHDEMGEPL